MGNLLDGPNQNYMELDYAFIPTVHRRRGDSNMVNICLSLVMMPLRRRRTLLSRCSQKKRVWVQTQATRRQQRCRVRSDKMDVKRKPNRSIKLGPKSLLKSLIRSLLSSKTRVTASTKPKATWWPLQSSPKVLLSIGDMRAYASLPRTWWRKSLSSTRIGPWHRISWATKTMCCKILPMYSIKSIPKMSKLFTGGLIATRQKDCLPKLSRIWRCCSQLNQRICLPKKSWQNSQPSWRNRSKIVRTPLNIKDNELKFKTRQIHFALLF